MDTDSDLSIEGLDEVYGTDTSKEADGAWVDVAGLPAGTQMRLRSQASLKVENFTRRQTQKHLALHRAGQVLPAEVEAADELDRLVKVIVTGWRGFVNGKTHEPVPYTEANARAVFTKWPHLRRWAAQQSASIENFRRAETDDMAGNSAPPSAPN